MTVQDLVGKGKTPGHQSLGNLGATFSHLFQKLLADVGETSQLLTTGVLQRFPLIFFFLLYFSQPVFVLRLLG